jgi:glycyl-tRNA synthetase beta subunit
VCFYVLQVPAASAYLSLLQQQGIQLDFEARKEAIWQGAAAAAAEVRQQHRHS